MQPAIRQSSASPARTPDRLIQLEQRGRRPPGVVGPLPGRRLARHGKRHMSPESQAWLAALRALAAEMRAERGPAADDRPSAAAAAEVTILDAHLASWLETIESLSAGRRERAARDAALDPAPAIVLTTSPIGILAAEERLAGDGPRMQGLGGRVACVTEREYRRHCMRRPDESHRLHVNHWNWVKSRVPPQRAAEFARHPLAAGECYWLHRTGTAGAGTADRRDCHLWRWNGREAALLEAFVEERGAGRLGSSPRAPRFD